MPASTKSLAEFSWIVEGLRPLATPVDALVLDPANARRHGERNLASIKSSLRRYGQRKPIVVRREGMVVEAGNGTLEAARALGWTHVAAVVVDDDPTTATGFAIADNRSAELAEWDQDALAKLLGAVKDAGVPSEDVGFSDAEVLELLAPGDAPEPAADPGSTEPPATPRSVTGEVYALGPHRLLCGDSRDFTSWAKLLGDERANVIFTSPPYASQRTYDESSGFRPIAPDDYVEWWEPLQACAAAHLAPDGSFFVNVKEHAEDGQRHLYVKDLTIAHVRRWGWLFVDELCWTRQGVPGGWPNRFKNAWEPVFHFSRESKIKFRPEAVSHESDFAFEYSKSNPKSVSGSGLLGNMSKTGAWTTGQARPSNVVRFTTGGQFTNAEHSAAFPVALPEFFVNAFSDEGDLVVDPFLGSGTTLIASAKHGRHCYGFEISPAYCDVIRIRWTRWAREAGVDPGTGALDA